MLAEIIRWTCNALIGLMLFRAARKGFVSRYPVFYFYLIHVLVLSVLRFYIHVYIPAAYVDFYWYTSFINVAVGYCVIWEIFRQVLADYPGAARLAQRVVWMIFVVVVAKDISNALTGPWSPAATVEELERSLRVVQALLLIAVLGLLAYYAIPIGQNLRGILLGYSFFIGISIINLTLLSRPEDPLRPWWQYSLISAYSLALLIWTGALWSYHPNPKPEVEIEIERDYELLSRRTAGALAKARSYLAREVVP